MKKLLVVLCISVMFFCSAGMANALLVDFTKADPWKAAVDNQHNSGYIDVLAPWLSVRVKAAQVGDLMSFNHNDGAGLPSIPGFANEGDGIGIIGEANYDEIDPYKERLRIDFSPGVQSLNTIYLLDLFYPDDSAIVSIDLGDWLPVTQPSGLGYLATTYGFLGVDVDVDNVMNIRFDTRLGNYAVAGVDVDPVPEPTTMLLLGSGLIGLAGLGRKKFFKKG